ncbi:MAG: HAD-IA family hydrolase [Desulfovibrionaceae bacterium]|jgi:HAD superfamily hydrolase (TIGR01509 family)|nr:HAD-IA family hydrolase [Desulfovibrionaceae bacterium]
MRIDALLFDVDGTLADTEEAHRIAFNAAFERAGLDWRWQPREYRRLLEVTGGKERIRGYIGALPVGDGERRRLLERVSALHEDKTRIYTRIVRDGGVRLRPGVERLMREALAAGCRLAIATTTSAVNVQALLEATLGARGLDWFSAIACGDQALRKKPAPDIHQLALARLGIEPARAVAIEDSLNGLRAARAAGLWTLVTPNFWTEGADFEREGAGLVLPHLGEPALPLAGEPGHRLRHAAWLRFDELTRAALSHRVDAAAGVMQA